MKITLFLAITSVALVLSGCTTTGYTVVGTASTTVDNTVRGRTINSEEYKLTQEAARLKYKLAKLEAKVAIAKAEAQADAEKAKARAANPCAGWVLAPSYCYGYTPYATGVYYGGGTAVVNGYPR